MCSQRKEDKDKKKKKGDDDEWSDPTKIDESALSEEDLALKQNMDMLVERVMEPVSEARPVCPRLPPSPARGLSAGVRREELPTSSCRRSSRSRPRSRRPPRR